EVDRPHVEESPRVRAKHGRRAKGLVKPSSRPCGAVQVRRLKLALWGLISKFQGFNSVPLVWLRKLHRREVDSSSSCRQRRWRRASWLGVSRCWGSSSTSAEDVVVVGVAKPLGPWELIRDLGERLSVVL
ncbi:MAG: hypothetical protein ACKPKO_65365, partial [Candidatus Fonsibacter sp.]